MDDVAEAMRVMLERLKNLSQTVDAQLNKAERYQSQPNYKIKSLLPSEENKTGGR